MEVYRLPDWVENDYDLELYHHGVKGQRWGVRRYQNPDGTLTAKGRAKLEKLQSREIGLVEKRKAKIQASHDKSVQKLSKKLVDAGVKGKDRKVKKIANKMHEEQAKYEAGKKLADDEIKVLKNYKLSDFNRENHDMRVRAGNLAATAAVSTLAAIPLAAVTGVMVYTVPSMDIKAEKTQYRTQQNGLSDKAYSYKQVMDNDKSSKRKIKKYQKKYNAQLEKDRYKYGG